MSPEQASGGALDFRSDQFALGSVLYEMATGRRAFAGETRPEVLAAIIREEPEPIAAAHPKIPAPLRWIIERCLAKSPGERYASTEDLARDLRSAEAHLSELSGASGGGPSAVASAPRGALRLVGVALAAGILAARRDVAGGPPLREPFLRPLLPARDVSAGQHSPWPLRARRADGSLQRLLGGQPDGGLLDARRRHGVPAARSQEGGSARRVERRRAARSRGERHLEIAGRHRHSREPLSREERRGSSSSRSMPPTG